LAAQPDRYRNSLGFISRHGRGSSVGSDSPQVLQEFLTLRSMLSAGIVDCMETGSRTTDAAHFVVKDDADRRGPSTHDLVEELGGALGMMASCADT
jgi:hypothetical protein